MQGTFESSSQHDTDILSVLIIQPHKKVNECATIGGTN